MRIYFAGIGGVGIGPLAAMAKDAGYDVMGYDQTTTPMTDELSQKDIPLTIGDGLSDIQQKQKEKPIDWLVATAALPKDSPIFSFARGNRIRISKRDELINQLVGDKHQQLIAISGTHGKTTTTAMLAWLFTQFDIPESHSVGTQMSFAASGKLASDGRCFIYEADEYDRNMLHFHPSIAVITSLDYDHPDVYSTPDDYKAAFRQFLDQSERVFMWQKDADYLNVHDDKKINLADSLLAYEKTITLPGEHNRRNALLACAVFKTRFPELKFEHIMSAMSLFPGTQRRFERIAKGLYSDYAHHPAEIAATIQTASELSKKIVVVYQPHQNIRQHDLIDKYEDCFRGATKVYWLPTYLSRENPQLPVLTSKQLIAKLTDPSIAEPAKLDESLIQVISRELHKGALVLVLGAGDVDTWLREHLQEMID